MDMLYATRLGDTYTGHDACPGTVLVSASTDVIINGKGAGRVGDSYAPHGCIVHPAHTAHIASGSSTVLINGLHAARVGDPIDAVKINRICDREVIIGG